MSNNVKKFHIFVGLPGTGKTTRAKEIAEQLEGTHLIISRDIVRCDLIWEYRKLDQKEKDKKMSFLDEAVSEQIRIKILNNYEKYDNILIDGCHTNAICLLDLIIFIRKLNDCASVIYLVFIGDEFSKCNHVITNKKEGDYSDYNEDKTHFAIPKEVFFRKREELTELFTKFFNIIRHSVDSMHFLIAWHEDEEVKESLSTKI